MWQCDKPYLHIAIHLGYKQHQVSDHYCCESEVFNNPGNENHRSRWPSGQRCRSAAARLLGWRARIPPGVCLLWTGRSLVQGSPTECVSLSVIRWNNNPLRIHWISRRDETKRERKKKEVNGNRNTSGRCTSECCHVRLLRIFLCYDTKLHTLT